MPVDAVEVGTHESAVPRPAVFGVAGGVNANVPAASPNIAFKRCLLAAIEYLTGSQQEDDGVVLCQVRVGKSCCILREIGSNVVFNRQLAQGRFCGRDRLMAERTRLGEDEYLALARVSLRCIASDMRYCRRCGYVRDDFKH